MCPTCPEEDGGQQEGDEDADPHRQRQQGVAVPVGAEPGHRIAKLNASIVNMY